MRCTGKHAPTFFPEEVLTLKLWIYIRLKIENPLIGHDLSELRERGLKRMAQAYDEETAVGVLMKVSTYYCSESHSE